MFVKHLYLDTTFAYYKKDCVMKHCELFTRAVPVFMLMLLAVSFNGYASGIRNVSEHYLMKAFSHVCIIDVQQIEITEDRQTFNDGTSRRIATNVIMDATPVESLKGDCGTQPIKTRYTTPKTVSFNDEGNIRMRYTILKTSSGLEMNVRVNQRYIVSFYHWHQGEPEQRHYRINAIEDKDRIVSLIADTVLEK